MSRIGLGKRERWLIIGLFALMVIVVGLKNFEGFSSSSSISEKSYGSFNVVIQNVVDSNLLFITPGHFDIDSISVERIEGASVGTMIQIFSSVDAEQTSVKLRINEDLKSKIGKKTVVGNLVDQAAKGYIVKNTLDSTVSIDLNYMYRRNQFSAVYSEIPMENFDIELNVLRFDSLASLDIIIKAQSSFWQNSTYGGNYLLSAKINVVKQRIGRRIVN